MGDLDPAQGDAQAPARGGPTGPERATRAGASGGRDGFRWSGDAYVGRKSEWATWTPPREMIKRQPEAAKWARGMPGGPDHPLGAPPLHPYHNGPPAPTPPPP